MKHQRAYDKLFFLVGKQTNILSDITTLDLMPVVLALCMWGVILANKNVLFHIDNQSLVTILNKQTSKSQKSYVLASSFYYRLHVA